MIYFQIFTTFGYKNLKNSDVIGCHTHFKSSEGRAEGIDLGDAKAKREIAAKMKSMGLSPEQIAQATDLSIEAINSL